MRDSYRPDWNCDFARVFCALLLAVQFGVPLLPMWGAFVPHGHIARAQTTARDWQAHGENHRNPPAPSSQRADAKILVVGANDGLTSLPASIDVVAFPSPFTRFPARDFSKRRAQDCFFARPFDLPVLVPPPNA